MTDNITVTLSETDWRSLLAVLETVPDDRLVDSDPEVGDELDAIREQIRTQMQDA